MSEENGKVCCNCRHNIRTDEEINIECHCDIDDSWLSYVTTMTHCCRHWSDEICFYKKGEWKTVPEIKAEYKAVIQEKINSLKEGTDGENND